MNQAKDILPDLYRRGADRALEEWELLRAYWPEAVGRRLALHTRLVRLKGETLVVEVDDEAWRAQVEAVRGRIVESLRNEIPRSTVREIELRPMLPARRGPQRAQSAFGRPVPQAAGPAGKHSPPSRP